MEDVVFRFFAFVGNQARAVTHSFKCFFLLRTEALIAAAEEGDNRSKQRLAGAHIAVVILGYLTAFWLLTGEAAPPIWVTIRATILSLLVGVVLTVPVWLAFRFIARRPNTFFLLNLVSIVQAVWVGLFIVANLIVLAAEPARTDFSLIRSGLGQQTVAYKLICGVMENSAEKLVQARSAQERSRVTIADTRRLIGFTEQRFPAIGDELMRQSEEVQAQWNRRVIDAETTRADVTRLVQMANEEAEAEAQFFKRYPNFIAALATFFVGLVLAYALAGLHVWKAGVWLAVGWPSKLSMAGGLLVAAACSAAMVWLFVRLSMPQMVDLPSERPPLSRPLNNEVVKAEMTRMEGELDQLDLELQTQTSRLQAVFQGMKYVCPRLDPRGLWDAELTNR